MYLIDKEKNRITELKKKTFSELGFKERENLQEWLANNPTALEEDGLLIIQKEFNGFSDTNERLDLLGIDKQGNLVIIENKLDDTGKDVTWQALKYASYCSTLSKEQIISIYQKYLDKQGKNESAEENLTEFFNGTNFKEIYSGGQTQRIIMVAGHFRKEVTSTVIWLMSYKLRIQCFKVIPYEFENQLFLKIEQIIPMKDAEEFIISMAEKTQEEINSQEEIKTRHLLRIEFWKKLLNETTNSLTLFQNINPSKDNWISGSTGLSGVQLNFVISNSYARVELYITRSNKEENKFIFNNLYDQKLAIEERFGNPLTWEELPDKKASRIKYQLNEVDYFNREDWPKMIDFMVKNMKKLEIALKEPLLLLKSKVKSKNFEE